MDTGVLELISPENFTGQVGCPHLAAKYSGLSLKYLSDLNVVACLWRGALQGEDDLEFLRVKITEILRTDCPEWWDLVYLVGEYEGPEQLEEVLAPVKVRPELDSAEMVRDLLPLLCHLTLHYIGWDVALWGKAFNSQLGLHEEIVEVVGGDGVWLMKTFLSNV